MIDEAWQLPKSLLILVLSKQLAQNSIFPLISSLSQIIINRGDIRSIPTQQSIPNGRYSVEGDRSRINGLLFVDSVLTMTDCCTQIHSKSRMPIGMKPLIPESVIAYSSWRVVHQTHIHHFTFQESSCYRPKVVTLSFDESIIPRMSADQ